MRNIIYVLLLGMLSACCKERKPLEIRPLVAKDVMLIDLHLETTYYPVPRAYYFKNFRDDKQCLKEFMQYIEDTLSVKVARREIATEASFLKNNRGTYVEEGEGCVDQHSYDVWYVDSIGTYFKWFDTPSKYNLGRLYIDDFPQRCDYPYHIVSKDKSAIVYFDYKEFNTDVWQKFLNVVFYDRYSKEREDRKKYHLWDKKKARAWRNWSAPTRYSLLNQYTQEIECVIEYPLEDNDSAFTMEIR